MASATVYFGITVTAVSETQAPENLAQDFTQSCPVESRHTALRGNTSDFVQPSGRGGLSVPNYTNLCEVGHMVYDPPVPSRGWGHNHCTSSTKTPRHRLGSLTKGTDRFIECTTSMIGIYIYVSFPRLLTWLCLVSLFSLLCPLFAFVAQLRFHSQRGWSGDRISESHGILLEITECLVYKRLHSHNIASSCTSCTSFTKDAYPKIPQFSNTLFLTGKCKFVVAIDIAAFYLTFHWVPCTVAISFRLWRVYRQTAKAGIQVGDSIILVRITCCLTSKEAD